MAAFENAITQLGVALLEAVGEVYARDPGAHNDHIIFLDGLLGGHGTVTGRG